LAQDFFQEGSLRRIALQVSAKLPEQTGESPNTPIEEDLGQGLSRILKQPLLIRAMVSHAPVAQSQSS